MVIHFQKTLSQALENIRFKEDYHKLTIHDLEELRTIQTSDEIVGKYGEAKWKIVDLLNANYNLDFDLHNWLNKNKDDEVSYFLTEAGSNSLNHSSFKTPAHFHLWCGKKGFIIGIEQFGEGFPAAVINEQKLKENQGAAFSFFRECQSSIFFDSPHEAKTIFMECLIKDV